METSWCVNLKLGVCLLFASERSKQPSRLNGKNFLYIYFSDRCRHTVMFYVILNTPKSNFEMRVNIHVRARTFHAAALARNNACISC